VLPFVFLFAFVVVVIQGIDMPTNPQNPYFPPRHLTNLSKNESEILIYLLD